MRRLAAPCPEAPRPRSRRPGPSAGNGGFTLVELLVALAAMALLALVSWRGLEAMASAQASHRARDDAVLVLQTTLSQWQADLDAATAYGDTPALDWDGRALRLTRRSAPGNGEAAALVVAWALRADAQGGLAWWRWQSPPARTRSEWQQAWGQAASWAQGGGSDLNAAATPLLPLATWSLGYFRANAWGPALTAQQLGTQKPVPDGIRLVLQLPAGAGLGGTITRDWVNPTYGVARGG